MGRIDTAGGDPGRLEAQARKLWGAYLYLRDTDLQEFSGTARLLHGEDVSYLVSRLCDELRELAGVLSGKHRHSTPAEDLVLEGSQVCYWTYLIALRLGLDYEDLLPHEQLLKRTGKPEQPPDVLAEEIDFLTQRITSSSAVNLQPLLVQILEIVGGACRVGGGEVNRLIEDDLEQMEQRDYMRPYFASGKG